jgi:signal peptide peptidase SppA
MAIQQALSRLPMAPLMIEPTAVGFIAQAAQRMMSAEGFAEDMSEEMMEGMRNNLCQTYGYSGSTQGKNFAFADGTAIIPVHGSLINRYGGYYYGEMTGYNYIRRMRAEAMADPDVERIIYDVNSNGGEAAGCFELSDESFELRGEKPTLAVVDSNCYSAAYAFASSADKISVTPSGGAGSIGVISMHTDVSKLLEDYGVKFTLITAGDHKADGNPFTPLSDEVKAEIQADVDMTRDKFVALVARNRGIDAQVVRDTEARTFNADEALALNLIDEIATPTQAVNSFVTGPSGSTQEANLMKPEEQATTQQPDPNAVTAAKSAERARMSGILGCEAAKSNPGLANHLAFNTDMSVEEAVATMEASSPAPAAVAPATEQDQPKKEQANTDGNQNFMHAMNNGQHPKVGPDSEGDHSQRTEKEVNPLEADYTAATGYVFEQN